MLGLALFREVRGSLPAVRLEITEGPSSDISQLLSQGKLDVAVVFGSAMHAALRIKPLVTESLRLVGALGSFKSRKRRTLEQSAILPLLLMSRPNGIREELERIWAERGITPNVVADLNAPRLLIEAVQSGLGYGILPSCVFDRTQPTWKFDAVELRSGAPRRTVCLATSMLFPFSLAGQRVHNIVEALVYRAVKEGRWEAKVLGGMGELSIEALNKLLRPNAAMSL